MAALLTRTARQASLLLSLSGVLLLFSIIASITYFWYPGGIKIMPSGSYGGGVAGVLLLAGLYQAWRCGFRDLTFDYRAGVVGLALIFVSDWLCRGYGFMQGPSIRGEIILCTILAYWALSTVRVTRSAGWILAISIVGCLYCYWIEGEGRLLFSDDHGTFQYRLMLLKENFPFIPFYNPQWNAGLDARDSFATGVLNLFFMSLPWIYFFDVESWYTEFIAVLLFLLFPLVTAYAARLAGHRREVGWIAGLLIMTSGLHWYRWGLKYGTMGFVASAVLLPLTLAATARVLQLENVRLRHAVVCVLCLFLSLCWPFFGVVLLPLLVLSGVMFVCAWLRRSTEGASRYRRLLCIGLALLLMQGPIAFTFIGTSNIGKFLGHKETPAVAIDHGLDEPKQEGPQFERRFRHRAGHVDMESTFRVLRSIFFSSNPVLIVFGLGGLIFLRGWFRVLCVIQIAWFFLLGGILFPLKPQLELDRLLVLILLVLAIPAAEAVIRFVDFAQTEKKKLMLLSCAFVLGFMLTGPMVVWGIVRNRSVEQYYFASDMVTDFKELLTTYKPEGRLLFAGCILHEYAGGHLAPLAFETGVPMVASSPAHTLWWYKDVIPGEFLARGDVGKESYFDLYNVTDIFAHERKWKKYFLRRPDKYELIWSGHGFDLFRRRNITPSYVLEGNVEVVAHRTDGVLLRPLSRNSLIKFRYNAALEAPGCTVQPQKMYGKISFVALKDCTPGATVYLRSRVPWKQLFLDERKTIQ